MAFKYFLIAIIWSITSIICCLSDISCDFGYIWAKTYLWNTTITECIHPSSEQEIVDIVTDAMISNQNGEKTTVRAIGASISYSGVGMLDEFDFDTKEPQKVIVLNTTSNLTRIIDLNLNDMTLTFESGLRYIQIVQYLQLYNLSMYYTGGPLFANFVGWFMSATHGFGTVTNPIKSMANNVIGLRMVTGNGSVLIMNHTYNYDLLNAALISFGCLGIITQVTIKVKPTIMYLQQDISLIWVNQSDLQTINNTFYQHVIPQFYINDMANCWYHFLDEYFECQRWNYVNISDNISESSCWHRQNIINISHNLHICTDIYYKAVSEPTMQYAMAGNRMFQTEWFVPFDDWPSAQMEVIKYIHNQKIQNTKLWQNTQDYLKDINVLKFTHSWRCVGGDNIWFSPGGFDNNTIMMQIAQLFAEGFPPNVANEWVKGVYNLYKKNAFPVRVHWGKISMAGYCDLQDSYPKLDDFIELREELDPYNIFLNSFTRDKLGLCHDNDRCCCTGVSCFIVEDSDDSFNILLISMIAGAVFIVIVILILFGCWHKNKRNKYNKKQNELTNLLKD